MTAASLEVEGISKKIGGAYKKIDVFYKERHICVDRFVVCRIHFLGLPVLAPVRVLFGVILSPPPRKMIYELICGANSIWG